VRCVVRAEQQGLVEAAAAAVNHEQRRTAGGPGLGQLHETAGRQHEAATVGDALRMPLHVTAKLHRQHDSHRREKNQHHPSHSEPPHRAIVDNGPHADQALRTQATLHCAANFAVDPCGAAEPDVR
jgi:hypothetical protein